MPEGIDLKTASGWALALFVLFMQYGLPWLKALLHVSTEKERIKARIDEKGYKEVVAELGADLKAAREETRLARVEQKADKQELKDEVKVLRASEAKCQIEQARLQVQLNSARECITELETESASMRAEIKQLKGDSKSRIPSREERDAARPTRHEDTPPT